MKVTNPQKTFKKGRLDKTIGHIKMKVISDLRSRAITKVVKEQLEPEVKPATHDPTSYIKLNKLVTSLKVITSKKGSD